VAAVLKLYCAALVYPGMLRIAEHKDGPVLGVSAMLVAVGGFIKACAW
jgi:hypothetical protein